MKLVTGMRVKVQITSEVITDAKVYVESNSRVYICQDVMDGSESPDKLGYKHSWIVTPVNAEDHTSLIGRDLVRSIEVITGENDMEQEAPAKFVRLEKNTELFVKGTVFELYSSYYSALDRSTAFIDEGQRRVIDANVSVETVQRLGVKVFAPVTKFNPAYVTAEEDARLQAALKPVAAKKAPKTAKK